MMPATSSSRSEDMTRALLNILEDAAYERQRLEDTQAAVLNILDDFTTEKSQLENTQSAVLNILDDFHEERSRFQDSQKASLNILEDFSAERSQLEMVQKAVLNILDDFDTERAKVARFNEKLLQEIDERSSIEAALVQKGQALTRSNAELEQFAFIASHDLQAPLRTILSFVEILSGTLVTGDAATARYFGFISDGVSRMQALVKALLEYSRVGRDVTPFRLLSCTDICKEVLRDLKAQVEEVGAEVTFEGLPTVLGDYTLLRQLFQNLIGNAIKFRGDEAPVVALTARRVGHLWEFSVRDNGIGIDPAYATRLFVIFQRLHDRGQYPGTGIGLAICKKIVEYHSGRIWIEASAEGAGSVFAFTIPATAAVGPA